ncbi:hypothetical protein B0H34DRAFT_862781 [Crassisporium funariophilum]|nr:hypothetical protein B0H34DRAFT_862781 [Crassisporium funariophilum]
MRSSTYTAVFLYAIISLKGAYSAPLRALVGDGAPSDRTRVKNAVDDAHGMVGNMQHALDSSNPQSNRHIVKAFGHNANIPAIQHTVDALHNGRIKVPNPDPTHTGMGYTNMQTGHVGFGSAFHSPYTTDKERAGTVIHEATHALAGTVDHFSAHSGSPHGAGHQRGSDHTGYADSHLDHLKQTNSHNLHHNADSYRVFAQSCSRSLRRAFKETDPVKRDYIIARNPQCTKPAAKGKAAAAHAKTPAANHKAAKPAHYDAHKAGAPAHHDAHKAGAPAHHDAHKAGAPAHHDAHKAGAATHKAAAPAAHHAPAPAAKHKKRSI